MTRESKPATRFAALSRGGVCLLGAAVGGLFLCLTGGIATAQEPSAELDVLRHHAEYLIAHERATGHTDLANAMEETLPGLLAEVREKGLEATLQAYTTAPEHEGARQRGLTDLADHLDARLGSQEHEDNRQGGRFTLFVLTDGVRLSVTPSENVQVTTTSVSVTVNPGTSTTVSSPGNSTNTTVGFSGSPGNSGGGGGGGPPDTPPGKKK